jgi:F-type H+-transporting ATPase subunit a
MRLVSQRVSHIRRTIVFPLVFFVSCIGPLCVFAAEREAEGSSFELKEPLFEELTDSTEHPYAVVDLFRIGDMPVQIRITKHLVLMWIVGALVLLSMIYLARKLRNPFKKPTRLQGLLEVLIEYMKKEVFDPVLGSEAKRFYLFLFGLFFFVLYSNVLGLIPPFAPLRSSVKLDVPPGFLAPLAPKTLASGDWRVWLGGAVTGNLATTLGLGLMTFVVFNVAGMKAKGVVGYWKGLIPHGTPGWMAPITLLLEIVGLFSKTIALIMRLFANMIGGHVAIIIILIMVIKFQSLAVGPAAVLVDLAISALEIFVAILQAFIFSFLSALFIGLAVRKH